MSGLPGLGLVLSRAAALAAGVLFGFFVAFNAVFSDVFGIREMIDAIVYVIVSYLVLGAVVGAAGPATRWRWAPWLAAPGVLFAALMIPDAPERVPYVAAVVFGAAGGTYLGLWLGAAVRRLISRPKSDPGAPPPDEHRPA